MIESESEDDEADKARKESQKRSFFDQSVKLPTENNNTTFEQLSLSRPLLKVCLCVIDRVWVCSLVHAGCGWHGVLAPLAHPGPDHPHRPAGPGHLRVRRDRCVAHSSHDASCDPCQAAVRRQRLCFPSSSVCCSVPSASRRHDQRQSNCRVTLCRRVSLF